MQNKTYNIDNVMTRLLLEEPLWARVSRYINKVESKLIPTAGVRITDNGHFELMYNPDFFSVLRENTSNRDLDDRFSILRHELLHIVLSHVYDERLTGLPHSIKNVAYDLAINSHIENIKTFGDRYVVDRLTGKYLRSEDATDTCVPAELCVPGRSEFKDFPSGLIAEEYAELLKKKMCEKCGQMKDKKEEKKTKGNKKSDKNKGSEKSEEKQEGAGSEPSNSGSGESDSQSDSGCQKCSGCGKPQNPSSGSGSEKGDGQGSGNGSGNGVIDDHNWDDASEEAKQIARERMREILRDATNEINTNSLGWGSVPVNIRESIIKFVNGTIDWRKVLSYFVQSSVKVDRRNTMKKINRRFPYIHAGRTQNRTANIAISIDQSGSVGDDMLEAFFGELNKLATLVTFTVIPFDCSVEENLIEVWKKGQRQVAKRVKHGGTDFDAPTKYVNEAGIFDAHIILTDMQAPKPIPSRVPRMWMTTEDCMKHLPFSTNERIIPITVKK